MKPIPVTLYWPPGTRVDTIAAELALIDRQLVSKPNGLVGRQKPISTRDLLKFFKIRRQAE